MLVVKNLPANAGDIGDLGLIPVLGRSPGERHGNPLQYSCLENPMDRGAWQLQSMGSQRVGHDYYYSRKLREEFMNPKQNIFLSIYKNEKKNGKLSTTSRNI